MSDILYMKIDRNIELDKKEVFLSDVAKLECTNKDILSRVKAIKLMNIPDEKNNRFVFSVLKVIELIHKIHFYFYWCRVCRNFLSSKVVVENQNSCCQTDCITHF